MLVYQYKAGRNKESVFKNIILEFPSYTLYYRGKCYRCVAFCHEHKYFSGTKHSVKVVKSSKTCLMRVVHPPQQRNSTSLIDRMLYCTKSPKYAVSFQHHCEGLFGEQFFNRNESVDSIYKNHLPVERCTCHWTGYMKKK